MSGFLLLVVCLMAGVLFRLWKKLPNDTPAVLNGIVIFLALPSLVLSQLHRIIFDQKTFLFPLSAWCVTLLSFSTFTLVAKKLGLKRKMWGALILMTCLGNTSFLGYPIVEALYGHDFLKYAVLVDQLGSFLIFSTFGVAFASYCSSGTAGGKVDVKRIIKRIFSFPLIYVLVIATLTRHLHYPDALESLLSRLGDMVTPLALMSVGFQLSYSRKSIQSYAPALTTGLVFKLILAPAFIAFLYRVVFRFEGEAFDIAIVQAGMAPMITAAILVAEYDLDREFANLMVGIGIPLSLVTVPLWSQILRII